METLSILKSQELDTGLCIKPSVHDGVGYSFLTNPDSFSLQHSLQPTRARARGSPARRHRVVDRLQHILFSNQSIAVLPATRANRLIGL